MEPPRGTKKEFADFETFKKTGYMSEGRKNLYISLKIGEFNPQGFGLEFKDKSLIIIHKTGGVIWTYPLDYLFKKLKKKLSHKLLIVTAESKEENGKEFFYYNKLNLYSEITETGFIELIRRFSA